MPLLTAIVLLPLIGAAVVGVMRRDDEGVIKGTGLVTSLITFLVSLALVPAFRTGRGGIQLREYLPWLPEWGLTWNLGIDGISLFLVILSTFLTPLILLGAWNGIEKNVKAFVIAMLVLETAILGSFLSLNLFFFFLFWEAMLIPMVLIIGVWGSGDRIKSAIKFFLYTTVGSLLMLVAIGYLYFQSYDQLGAYSLNLADLLRLEFSGWQQIWLFSAFALAFLIKVPLFPLHTWLPDAHTDAPTPGSVVLAGVLLKLGTYGLARFAIPLFPEGAIQAGPWLVGLSVTGIIYGALVAWVQQDIKKLVAYSSVSHMGFVVLGLFIMNTKAAVGGVLQMINHGISTGALFLLIGMIYERRHTRDMDQYGGLAKVMPVYALFFVLATLSSIGLPGMNGFVGEFLVLLGSFQAGADKLMAGGGWGAVAPAVLAATGIILGAVYMLTLVLKVFFGPITVAANERLKDLSWREKAVMLPLLVMMFWIGIYPQPFLSRIEPSVRLLYERRLDLDQPEGTQPDRNRPVAVLPSGTGNGDEVALTAVHAGGER